MKKSLKSIVLLTVAWIASSATAVVAQDTGATGNGNWNTASIWTGGTVPNSSNNVYIGSTYPTGAANIATVALTANESAYNVFLGYGSGTSGTLDLGGNTLAITGSLFLGYYGPTGVLNEGGGSFTATNAYVGNGNSLTFGASDVVSYLQLNNSSSATTAATGNITGNIDVYSGSMLTAGADLSLSGNLNVQDSSTLNMQGHSMTANEVLFGWYGSSAVTLQNLGNITAYDLLIGNGLNFNLTPADTVTNFYLNTGASSTLTNDVSYLQLNNGSTATTTGTGSVTGYIDVYSSSTLTAGADLNLSGYLNVQDSSTLNMQGHDITASGILFGWYGSSAVTLQNLGDITATSLYVGNGLTFNLTSADTITNFYLNSGASSTLTNNVSYLQLNNGSTATTTGTGSVTGSIDVYGGSTLTAGADLNLSGYLNVQDSSTLNMQSHNITANEVFLGWYGSSAVTLQNLGDITATNLYVGNGLTFNITSSDTITNFYLNSGASSTLTNNVSYLQLNNGSTATTTGTGSVTGSIDVYGGSTLTAGADLNLSGNLNVQDSSMFNAQGHALTADSLLVGWYGSSAATVTNLGQVTLNNLYMGNSTAGSDLTLHGGDVINSVINLQNGSVLTVDQTHGIGLTLNGTSLSSLTIDPSSMDLIFTSTSLDNWDFRWMDPSSGGNWISTIDSMIASGQIDLTLLPGQSYSVQDSGGYTYIYGIGGASVPEPSSLVLACLATIGVATGMTWRRRRTNR